MEGNVFFFDTKTGEDKPISMTSVVEPIRCLQFVDESEDALIGTLMGNVYLWDIMNGSELIHNSEHGIMAIRTASIFCLYL